MEGVDAMNWVDEQEIEELTGLIEWERSKPREDRDEQWIVELIVNRRRLINGQ